MSISYVIGSAVLFGLKHFARFKHRLKHQEWRYAGGNINYLESRKIQGTETLVFLHGLGASKDQWGEAIYSLSSHYHCVFVDLPGEGDSDFDPTKSYSPASQVERIKAFLSAKQLDQVILVGASIGGCIAAMYAAENADQVKKLIAIAPAGIPTPCNSEAMERFIETGNHPFGYRSVAEMGTFWELVFHNPPSVPGILRPILAKKGRDRFKKTDKIVRDFRSAGLFPLEFVLEKVEAQTLIIWGREDRIFDVACVETVPRLLSAATISVIERAGHVPYLEEGTKISRQIIEFVGGADRTKTQAKKQKDGLEGERCTSA